MYPFTCLYAEPVKSVSENELVHSKVFGTSEEKSSNPKVNSGFAIRHLSKKMLITDLLPAATRLLLRTLAGFFHPSRRDHMTILQIIESRFSKIKMQALRRETARPVRQQKTIPFDPGSFFTMQHRINQAFVRFRPGRPCRRTAVRFRPGRCRSRCPCRRTAGRFRFGCPC